MTPPLQGKVALVIGAGSVKPGEVSNGYATALTYARAGARIVAVDLSEAALEPTISAIEREGLDCMASIGDASDEEDVHRIVAAATARFGSIDVLHNNVGILTFGSILDTDAATWDQIMALNVRSMFLATRAVLPGMIERGGGSIVNVSALASIRFLGAAITYTTSKAAVNGFTQGVALEYARHGIRCNAVLPGFIDTPVGLSVYEQGDAVEAVARKARRNACLPGGKAGEPWDIARAALFLASDASSYVNGLLLPVDGGVSLLSPTAV
jgi:NAD(P)-dependent dehydrogenase (short-subunit alcohol dehydrogenase family)